MKKITILLVLGVLSIPILAGWRRISQRRLEPDQSEAPTAMKLNESLPHRISWADGDTTPPTSFRLDTPVRITSAESSHPVWSPISSNELAFIGPDGTYVADIDTRSLRKLTGDKAGFKFVWTKDGKHLVFRALIDDHQMAIKSMNVLTGETKTLGQSSELSMPQEVSPGIIEFSDSGSDKVISLSKLTDSSSPFRPFVYQLNDNIFMRVGSLTKQLTTDGGKYFLPQLSPDGKKVLYQELSRGLYVTDLTANETKHLGIGDDAAWSPDSNFVVFEVTTDNDESVVGSELFASDLTGRRFQLTNTDNLIEVRPSWSSDGKRLAFEAGGYIYVATLVKVEGL